VFPRSGQQPLLMILPAGAAAPDGAALAWLVPASASDATLLAGAVVPEPR
jgi:hypothetical protein